MTTAGTNAHLQMSFSNDIRFSSNFIHNEQTYSINTHCSLLEDPSPLQTIRFLWIHKKSILFNLPSLVTRAEFSYKH